MREIIRTDWPAWVILLAIALGAVFGHPANANETITKRGIMYYAGQRYAPVTCYNNSSENAAVYYRRRIYACPHYTTTEIYN